MNFLKWLKNQSQRHTGPVEALGAKNSMSMPSFESHQPLRITVFRAVGGLVIQTSFFNQNDDDIVNSLHIVNDSDSLGESLSRIITIELLKMPRT